MKIRESQRECATDLPAAMATVHPQSPAGPTATPPLPQEEEERHGDAPDPPPAVSGEPTAAGADAGGEIAALDKQLAVVVGGGGEERRPAAAGTGAGAGAGAEAGAASAGGGGKLVAEAMRKYAAPRSSRFHGVTRYDESGAVVCCCPACQSQSVALRLCASSGLIWVVALIRGFQAQVERQVRGAPVGQHQPGRRPQAQGQARYARCQPRTCALARCKIL